MQPYVNPNYFTQYQQPQMNPYQNRMDFLQSYQQSLQPTQMSVTNSQMNVLGKIVDSIDAVKAVDIPADGNMYYFPKADGTEIFGKQWIVAEGRTRILSFKPLLEADPNNSSRTDEKLKIDPLERLERAFEQRFDRLENRIEEILAQSMTKSTTKTTASRTKKESAENE